MCLVPVSPFAQARAAAMQGLKALPRLNAPDQSRRSRCLVPAHHSFEAVVADLESHLAGIRQHCNDETRERKAIVLRQRESLKKAVVNKQEMSLICAECPEALQTCREVPTALPTTELHLPGDALAQRALLANAASRSGLCGRLRQEWDERNAYLMFQDQCAPVSEPPGSRPRLCTLMGSCFCAGNGQDAAHFQKRFASLVKPLFTPKRKPKNGTLTESQLNENKDLHGRRSLLKEGFVVIKFSMREGVGLDKLDEPDNAWARVAVRDSRGVRSGARVASEEVWFLVGYVNFTNWFLSGLVLHYAGVQRNSDGQEFIRLEVGEMGFYLGLYLFRDLHLHAPWCVTFYRVLSNSDILTAEEMKPNWVLVSAFDPLPTICVWRGSDQEAALRKQSTRKKSKVSGSRASAKAKPKPKSSARAKPKPGTSGPVRETLADAAGNEDGDEQGQGGDSTSDGEGWGFGLDIESEGQSDKEKEESDRSEDAASSPASNPVLEHEDDENEDDEDSDQQRPAEDEQPAAEAEPALPEPALPEPPLPSSSSRPALRPNAKPAAKAGSSRVKMFVDERASFEGFGELRYNIRQNNIVAICGNPRHGSECKRTRTCKSPPRDRITVSNLHQGRPVGLLAAWLEQSFEHSSSESHREAINSITHSQRVAARARFEKGGESQTILCRERKKPDGEDSEPPHIQ